VYQKPEPRSLEDALREGLHYEYKHRLRGIRRDISETEIVLLADLLAKIPRYPPEERVPAQEALEHDWLKSAKLTAT